MAVVIPQVITEDRAAAASHVTGSFQFPDRNGHHKLTYWPQSNGDQTTYTVSMWVKNSMPDAAGQNPLWSASPLTDNNNYYGLYLGGDLLRVHDGNPSNTAMGSQKLRDPNSWYHIHSKMDSNRLDLYVNGETYGTYTMLNANWWNNTSYRMDIGSQAINNGVTGSVYAGYQFAQVYHVDGQGLGPEYFGHTDPLTGVWSPKSPEIQANSAAYSYNIYSTSDNGSGAPSDLNTTSKTNITFATNGFDGNSATFCVNSDSSMTGWTVFRPASPIPVSSSLVIRCTRTGQIWLNGADSGVDNDQNAVQDITVPLGGATEITSIALQNSATVSLANRFAQIIVDGTVLTDQVTWGANGFYLPMDGKTPINEDQSPNGHNFYTTNYTTTAGEASGSLSNQTTLDKATGAIPIMRTDPSGQVVIGGPRTHRITYKVTVQNDGGNKYFLNGTRYSPGTLPMYRGGIYKFDQSDASNGTGGTHPLRFATAADAAGSTEYTDGVTQTGTPGQAGAYTLIVVPHNAPDTLHYYCTNHGGMGGPTANTTDIHVADPYAWKLQLALPFCSRNTTSANKINDGVNYTNADKPDTLNPLQTANTSLNTGTFPTPNPKESIFYGGAMRFSGGNSGGHYTLYSTSTATAAETMAFGTGDFTVECWAKLNSTGGSGASAIMSTSTTSQNSGSWIFGFDNGGNFGWCYDVNGFNWASTKIDGYFNTWHHYAATRKSGVLKLYIDGVQMFKFTDNTNYNYASSTPKIGQRWTNQTAYSIDGELQDLRVYKGVAKYGDNTNFNRDPAFLCGTIKPYFLPEVPKGTPYPGTLKKITGGSVYFNGGNNGVDRLMVANHSDFDLGTDDWTIELYFFVDENVRNYGVVLGKIGPNFGLADSSFYMNIGNGGTNNVAFNYVDGTTNANWRGVNSENYRLRFYEWNHAAVTKKGTEISVFVNGLLEATNTLPAVSAVKASTSPISIGSPYEYVSSASDYSYRGYISNVRIVKGTAVYEDDFVPTFEPLEAINGTVLLCCNSSTSPTEAVVSPTALTTNGNVGATNFSPFIDNLLQMQGPENNYAVLEASKIKTHASEVVEGLSINGNAGSAWNSFPGTMGASSGKWYWEVYDKDGYFDIVAGAAQDGSFHMWDTDVYVGQNTYGNSWGIMNNGTLYVNGSQTGSYFPAFAGSSIQYSTLGFALDMDSGKAYISLDGRWGSDAAPHTNAQISDGSATPAVSGLTGTYRPVISTNGGTTNIRRLDVNFGQRPFRFPPPEGYKCWNRTNMPSPNRAGFNASKYFKSVIWTGDAVNYRPLDIGFQPDLVWIKCRQPDALSHILVDSVRGSGYPLASDLTDPEFNSNNFVRSFEPNGVKLGTNARVNASSSSRTYVGWFWKAGGAAVTNDDGSIQSQVSANTDAGFSIVSYNGTGSNGTIGHGLTQAPEFVIYKRREATINWVVYHKDLDNPATEYLEFSTAGPTTQANMFNSTQPTDSVLSIGTDTHINVTPTEPFIAYCFHSVDGFSSIGKYIGNGSTNGPVIYTEFKPSFVMLKRLSSPFQWMMYDSARVTTNPIETRLLANSANAEGSYANQAVDFLSNGFKIRGDDSDVNTGGADYIYVAFAEAPTNAGFGAVTNAR